MESEAGGGETEPPILSAHRWVFLGVLSVYKQTRLQEAAARGSGVTRQYSYHKYMAKSKLFDFIKLQPPATDHGSSF